MKRTAVCSCGQLQIEVDGEPESVGICHCFECQRRTGSVFATLAAFRAPYRINGTSKAHRRTGDEGAIFTFHFCPECGTNLFHTEIGCEDKSVGVAVGCFADPDFPPPIDSVYDSRRHKWVQIRDGIRRHAKDPD